VIATASSAEKLAVCAAYGAEVTVDYRTDDFCAAVLDATGGRGADVVFDPVGGNVFARSLECSALEARVIPIGWASGTRPAIDPEEILRRNLTIVGLSWGSAYPRARPELVRDAHQAILREYAAGAIKPHVPHVWSFDELPDAVQALADGRIIGKAVVAGA
jgi:NADPH2:quinone reductase